MVPDPAKSQLADGSLEYRLEGITLRLFDAANPLDTGVFWVPEFEFIYVNLPYKSTPVGISTRNSGVEETNLPPSAFVSYSIEMQLSQLVTSGGNANRTKLVTHKPFFSYEKLDNARALAYAKLLSEFSYILPYSPFVQNDGWWEQVTQQFLQKTASRIVLIHWL
jgi:hypothetical protein